MCANIGDVVTSLTFVTNKNVYGPYGKERGQRFESLSGGKVMGFFGKSGTLLDQLGVLYQFCSSRNSTQHLLSTQSCGAAVNAGKNVITSNDDSGVSNNGQLVVEGPWGGLGGRAFHDGPGRIVEINLTYHKNQINSLQADYEHGGVAFQGRLHGISSGTSTKVCIPVQT